MNALTEVLNKRCPLDIGDEMTDYLRGEGGEVKDVELITLFGAEKLKRLFVIVEVRDGRGLGLSAKRRYTKEFTDVERAVLSRWYPKIYSWMLRTGIPFNGVRMSVKTYHLLCRFADFYAGVA